MHIQPALPPCSTQAGEPHPLLQVDPGTPHAPKLAKGRIVGSAWSSASNAVALVPSVKCIRLHGVLQHQVLEILCLPTHRPAPCWLCAGPLVPCARGSRLLQVHATAWSPAARWQQGTAWSRRRVLQTFKAQQAEDFMCSSLAEHPLLCSSSSTQAMTFL